MKYRNISHIKATFGLCLLLFLLFIYHVWVSFHYIRWCRLLLTMRLRIVHQLVRTHLVLRWGGVDILATLSRSLCFRLLIIICYLIGSRWLLEGRLLFTSQCFCSTNLWLLLGAMCYRLRLILSLVWLSTTRVFVLLSISLVAIIYNKCGLIDIQMGSCVVSSWTDSSIRGFSCPCLNLRRCVRRTSSL